MAAFAGMRGTGDWVTDQRPFHWRKDMLRIWPQGDMPLTAITANMRSIVVDDPKFNRWTKVLPSQAADLTNNGVYTDVSGAVGAWTAYVLNSSGVVGDTVYCNMVEADAKQFRIRHLAMMRDSDNTTVDIRGEVVARGLNGANSYVAVKLIEADNTTGSYDLSTVDRLLIIGNWSPEGAEAPAPVVEDPSSDYNLTQIWWNTLSQTGTAIVQ